MTHTLDVGAVEELVTRIDARLDAPGGKIVGFLASGRGEGVTTLAQAYAAAVVTRLQHRVLLLGVERDGCERPDVFAALAAGETLDNCLQRAGDGWVSGVFGGLGKGAPGAWDQLRRRELWDELRKRFDVIVLDLPASSESRLGLVCATLCDGVVVVVEAEKTRAPVVENLISSLRSVGANLLGTILNRRRFYLPQRIYRWL